MASMQQIITAKLKRKTTPEQRQLLRQTQLAYRDALNYANRYAFVHGKISSERRLHKEIYYDVRAQFKLPSEMTNNVICTEMRQVFSPVCPFVTITDPDVQNGYEEALSPYFHDCRFRDFSRPD